MKKRKLSTIGYYIGIALLAVLILGSISLEIYLWVTYSKVPITDIPAWALFFMFGKKQYYTLLYDIIQGEQK